MSQLEAVDRLGMRPESDMRTGIADQPLSCLLQRIVAGLRADIVGELTPLKLSFPQYICLQMLGAEPGQSNADLARRLDVSPQAMNGVLRGLQDTGLVHRPANANTGRALHARLTARGVDTLQRADAAVRSLEEHVLANLSHTQRTDLRNAVIALASRSRTTRHTRAHRHVEVIHPRGEPD
jgi:DNA-binding MarR family transcriptional regulator